VGSICRSSPRLRYPPRPRTKAPLRSMAHGTSHAQTPNSANPPSRGLDLRALPHQRRASWRPSTPIPPHRASTAPSAWQPVGAKSVQPASVPHKAAPLIVRRSHRHPVSTSPGPATTTAWINGDSVTGLPSAIRTFLVSAFRKPACSTRHDRALLAASPRRSMPRSSGHGRRPGDGRALGVPTKQAPT